MNNGSNKSDGKTLQKAIWIGIMLVCVVIIIKLIPHMEPFKIAQDHEPPVITGVKDEVTLVVEGPEYDKDYDLDDIEAAVLAGVTAEDNMDKGKQAPRIRVRGYDDQGNEMTEYPPGTYRIVYSCEDRNHNQAARVESVLTIRVRGDAAPEISGAADRTIELGDTVSYREGVTVTDDKDADIKLHIDSSAVDLNTTGTYPVIYSAVDSGGNRTEVAVTLTVAPATLAAGQDERTVDTVENLGNITEEQVNALADNILARITNAGMSQKEKAKAIYDYVHTHIRYVGTSDKSSWVIGAYVGFTRGRGDCYNYFACSKALLTRAGIPNVDLRRVGGTTRHYWQLVNVGEGYYHFDTCPHPAGYPLYSFLLTEQQVRDYTQQVSAVRQNYFVYDYASCPVTVVGTPASQEPVPSETLPTETAPVSEPPVTETPPAETGEVTPPPAETQAPPPAVTPTPPPAERENAEA